MSAFVVARIKKTFEYGVQVNATCVRVRARSIRTYSKKSESGNHQFQMHFGLIANFDLDQEAFKWQAFGRLLTNYFRSKLVLKASACNLMLVKIDIWLVTNAMNVDEKRLVATVHAIVLSQQKFNKN